MPAPCGPVHADRVHLVEERDGSVPLGQAGDLRQGRNVAAHRVHGLQDDEFRPVRIDRGQQLLQVLPVIVSRNMCLRAPLCRNPSMMDAWFAESENAWQSSMTPASTDSDPSLAEYPEAKRTASSLPCRSANSRSKIHMAVVRAADVPGTA
ncbi:hypothetical protein SFUMM280S_08523 [Streptomyces fumanus]